jgi:hypothetical protein
MGQPMSLFVSGFWTCACVVICVLRVLTWRERANGMQTWCLITRSKARMSGFSDTFFAAWIGDWRSEQVGNLHASNTSGRVSREHDRHPFDWKDPDPVKKERTTTELIKCPSPNQSLFSGTWVRRRSIGNCNLRAIDFLLWSWNHWLVRQFSYTSGISFSDMSIWKHCTILLALNSDSCTIAPPQRLICQDMSTCWRFRSNLNHRRLTCLFSDNTY